MMNRYEEIPGQLELNEFQLTMEDNCTGHITKIKENNFQKDVQVNRIMTTENRVTIKLILAGNISSSKKEHSITCVLWWVYHRFQW